MGMASPAVRMEQLKPVRLDAVDIITLIAIILFARLGIRLLMRYKKIFRKDDDEKDS